MRLQTTALSGVAAILLGLAQCYFVLYCWAYIAAYSPLPQWLLDLGLRASVPVVLFPVDFLATVALSLPAGLLLTKLRPPRLGLYLLLAVVPGFIWLNRDIVDSPLSQFPGSMILGWLPQLLALPCAAWLMLLMANRVAPNNSFKPNTLRGGNLLR
jgi:hypothetical protein